MITLRFPTWGLLLTWGVLCLTYNAQTDLFVEKNKVMFCRVCGFWARVWESYRTSRCFGCGYGSVTELTEVPGIVARAYITHRSTGWVLKMLYPYPRYYDTGRTELTEVPGTGMNGLQNSQKFRVRVWKSYRTSISSGYCGTDVRNLQKFRAGIKCCTRTPGIVARSYRSYRSSGYGYVCRTELTGVLCTGMGVAQNSQKFRIWVIPG